MARTPPESWYYPSNKDESPWQRMADGMARRNKEAAERNASLQEKPSKKK